MNEVEQNKINSHALRKAGLPSEVVKKKHHLALFVRRAFSYACKVTCPEKNFRPLAKDQMNQPATVCRQTSNVIEHDHTIGG